MKTRLFVSTLLTTALLGGLFLPGAAEQLFIRNHPFKGTTVHDGAGTWVDLKEFAAALDAKLVSAPEGGYTLVLKGAANPATPAAGKVAMGSEMVDIKEEGGKNLVCLEESARALGLKVTPNRSLGTVDVNMPVVGQIQDTTPPPPPPPEAAPTPSTTKKKKLARGQQPVRTASTQGGLTPQQREALDAMAHPEKAKPKFPSNWLTSYDQAVLQSERSGKPIMMDFTGSDWCGYCQDLHARVFDTADFQRWAASHVILLELDFPRSFALAPALKKQNDELAEKYQVTGYPTIVFTDSKGKSLGFCGFQQGTAQDWIKSAGAAMGSR